MSFIDDIRKKLNGNKKSKDAKELANKLSKATIEEIGANGDDNKVVMENAATSVFGIVEQMSKKDREIFLTTLVRSIDGSENIDERTKEKLYIIVAEKKGIPASAVAKEMEDAQKAKLVTEATLKPKSQEEIVDLIEDPDIQQKVKKELDVKEEKRIIDGLNIIRKEIKSITDEDMVILIKNVVQNVESLNIRNKIMDMIAEKMALNWKGFNGASKIYTFTSIIEIPEMLKINLPQLVREKYLELEEPTNDRDRIAEKEKFYEKDLRNLIIKTYGREIGRDLINGTTPVVMIAEYIGSDEKELLKKIIKSMVRDDVGERSINYVEKQIDGLETNTGNLEDMVKSIQELDSAQEQRDVVVTVQDMMNGNDNKGKNARIDIYWLMKKEKLLENLEKLPENERNGVVSGMNEALEKYTKRFEKNNTTEEIEREE